MTAPRDAFLRAARKQAAAEGCTTTDGTVCVSADRATYVDHAKAHGPDAKAFDALGKPSAHA